MLTIAEDSTAWPMVTRPTSVGGLGFDLKWDLGWMHDTLAYMSLDPLYRKHHHNLLTFRAMYAFSENYVLPLSHDEVVHGKGSLLGKMPGDAWQKFANLRLLLGWMHAQPGKKLLFMGDDFGQEREWNHDTSLDWHLMEDPMRRGLSRWVRDLNTLYRGEPALHELDCHPTGFTWVDCHDADQSVVSLIRTGKDSGDAGPLRPQFHARAPAQLPHRRPERRPLGGSPQQRRSPLRRQRPGQRRRRPGRAGVLARPVPLDQPDLAPAGDAGTEMARGIGRAAVASHR